MEKRTRGTTGDMLRVASVVLFSVFGLLSAFFSGEHHVYYTGEPRPRKVLTEHRNTEEVMLCV